jgi:predicted RNA-binding Zn-ribbon protein involved in translation (DUF1610 family)
MTAMLKFRCQHCGQRVAVPSRNLGKLVTCSECGMQTHPLAEQIVAAAPSTAPRKADSATVGTPRQCDNCGAGIGRLESPYEWNDHVVCSECYQRLSGASGGIAVAVSPVASRVAPLASTVITRIAPGAEPASSYAASVGPKVGLLELRERVLRALIIFVVASVALYGALSLLRDIAGLVAVAAVAVLALLSLYAVFRGSIATRRRAATSTELAPLRPNAG